MESDRGEGKRLSHQGTTVFLVTAAGVGSKIHLLVRGEQQRGVADPPA